MPVPLLTTALEKGLDYLRHTQRPSGEFATYNGPRLDMVGASPYPKAIYVTTFVSHALACLTADRHQAINDMQQRAGDFLAGEQEETGDWNYDGRGERLIPTDLDDTCCATAALLTLGRRPAPSFYAHLWRNEAAPGGPYYTWIGINDRPADPRAGEIDALVNANILFCCGLLNLSLPGTVDYVQQVIRAETYETHSVYCVSPHFLIYALSRAFADGHVAALAPVLPRLQAYLLTKLPPPQAEPSAFNLACLATSLLNLKAPASLVEPYLTALLAKQRPDGHWPAWAAWHAYHPNYHGAPALTTAIALEALGKRLIYGS